MLTLRPLRLDYQRDDAQSLIHLRSETDFPFSVRSHSNSTDPIGQVATEPRSSRTVYTEFSPVYLVASGGLVHQSTSERIET